MGDSTTKSRVAAFQLPDDRTTEPGPTVAWTYYPTLQQRRTALAVLGLLLAVGLLVAWITGKWYLGAMATLAGVVSTWRLYVPIRYELNNQGVTQSVWRRRCTIDWRSVGRIELLDDGMRLLPAEARFGKLEELRAIFVPWGKRREEVLKCIEFHAPYLLPQGEAGMEHGAWGMGKEKGEESMEHGASGMEKEGGEEDARKATKSNTRDD